MNDIVIFPCTALQNRAETSQMACLWYIMHNVFIHNETLILVKRLGKQFVKTYIQFAN